MSLVKVGPSITNTQTLVEMNSTKEIRMAVGSAVSMEQPVLLVGEAGLGKTKV